MKEVNEEKYLTPSVEVVDFDKEDVIQTSGGIACTDDCPAH